MRRRLDLAAGLILSPAVLFLDEPTTGLDPRGRNEVWAAVRALVDEGVTVLLTTQYLEEADQLADRIAVIDRGRVIAEDTPGGAEGVAGRRLDRRRRALATTPARRRRAAAARARAPSREIDAEARRVSAPVTRPHGRAAAPSCASSATRAEDIALRRPTLDEVFLRADRTEVRA